VVAVRGLAGSGLRRPRTARAPRGRGHSFALGRSGSPTDRPREGPGGEEAVDLAPDLIIRVDPTRHVEAGVIDQT
jgi:hypothetical protein